MRKTYTTLTDNYITSRLQGRTGNMMFQIAHGYAKSLEYNRQFVLPSKESSSHHLEKNLFRKLSFDIETTNQSGIENINCSFEYNEYKPADSKPTVFTGWFQSEKYFAKYSEPVKDLFSPPISFLDKVFTYYPFFKNKTVAAINVRRGDYLHPSQNKRHPVVSLEYIKHAYTKLPNHDVLLVMSDDMDWCRENIKLTNTVFNDTTKFWDAEGIWLLSLCDHFIISNSTYSWWGAYLSRTPDKTVIAPDTWFGPEHDLLGQSKDIYCKDWIKIPTVYQDGYINLVRDE
jgi:hypothetical protein